MTRDPMIIARSLDKTFDVGKPSEVRAVRDVSMNIAKGEIVLVMGPSGSGKTTLITLLSGLAHPTSGSVKAAGVDLGSSTSSQLTKFRRGNVGFVFQSFHLLQNLCALDNVGIALRLTGKSRQRAKQEARKLLVRLGLEKRLHAYPKELSGGEKQRVSIARALANNPSIIFADEPTANLDSASGHDVMRLLCGVACQEQRTVVIVSHDQRLKEMAMRVLTLEDGQLVREEQGLHTTWCAMQHT